jgi:hypothetical protein
MTTNKSPVYHRTSDGRKVVILERCEYGDCKCYVLDYEWMVNLHETELTPWVEPETRTVYLCWNKDGHLFLQDVLNYDQTYSRAIKKITITEGEFDE